MTKPITARSVSVGPPCYGLDNNAAGVFFKLNDIGGDSFTKEIEDFGASCTDPVVFLEHAFEIFCKHWDIARGAIWTQLQTGEIAKIHDRQWPDEDFESTGASCKSCRERVKESILLQEVMSGPSNALPSENGEPWTVLIPIRAQGEVRAVFSFFWSADPFTTDQSPQPSLEKFRLLLELQLADTLERARELRKQNPWLSTVTRCVNEGNRPSADEILEPISTTRKLAPTSTTRMLVVESLDTPPVSDSLHEGPQHDEPSSAGTSLLTQPHLTALDSLVSQQSKLLELARGIGRHADPTLVAFDVANELRAYFCVGRVGVLFCKGDRCKLAALSGIESFDKRSAVVQSLESLVEPIARIGDTIWHPEQQGAIPEPISQRIDRYYEATDARSIAVLPIHEVANERINPDDLSLATKEPNCRDGRVIAVLTIEGLREAIEREALQDSWSAAEPYIANALQNAVHQTRIPLLPVWLAIGDLFALFRGHQRNMAMAATTIAIAIMLALGLAPSPITLRATGTIQPIQRARIYCETPGIVKRLHVEDGMQVARGMPLIELENPTLDVEFERLNGEYQEVKESLASTRNHLNSNRVQDEPSLRAFRKERAVFEARLQSLGNQLELLQRKRSKLQIASPIDGRVITWDIQKRLADRPIEPGQHLLTVANNEGPWELELRIPDRLTGYLRNAYQNSDQNGSVTVQFVLASNPTKTYTGTLRKIADSHSLTEEEGSIVRAYVDVTGELDAWMANVRPGTEVIAHIHVGRGSLGHSLSFEFIDWIRRMRFRYLW